MARSKDGEDRQALVGSSAKLTETNSQRDCFAKTKRLSQEIVRKSEEIFTGCDYVRLNRIKREMTNITPMAQLVQSEKDSFRVRFIEGASSYPVALSINRIID